MTLTRQWSCWIEVFTWRVWRSSWCFRICLRSADSADTLMPSNENLKCVTKLCFLQNSSSRMDLLPSQEDLDNTGFKVTDKKSMLALIGEHWLFTLSSTLQTQPSFQRYKNAFKSRRFPFDRSQLPSSGIYSWRAAAGGEERLFHKHQQRGRVYSWEHGPGTSPRDLIAALQYV